MPFIELSCSAMLNTHIVTSASTGLLYLSTAQAASWVSC
jgi:hypothetical protein